MKITGYTIESQNYDSQPSWYVKNAEGVIVGCVRIRAHSNPAGSYCSNLSSGVYVEACGPLYFIEENRLAKEGKVNYRDISMFAKTEAQKHGQHKSWSRSGCGGKVSERKAQGREIAKLEAWPWLINLLGTLDKSAKV